MQFCKRTSDKTTFTCKRNYHAELSGEKKHQKKYEVGGGGGVWVINCIGKI